MFVKWKDVAVNMDKVDVIRITNLDPFSWTLRMYMAGGADDDYVDIGDFPSPITAEAELTCILRAAETGTNWEIMEGE